MTGDAQTPIIEEARKLTVDALFCEKAQFIASVHWRRVNYWIGIPAAVIAGIAGAAILGGAEALVPGLLALLASVLAALNTFLNPADRAAQHHAAGVQYAQLRRRLRLFVQIEPTLGTHDGVLKERLDHFTEELSDIQAKAPPLYPDAHKKAKKEIDGGLSDYTDSELEAAAGKRVVSQ